MTVANSPSIEISPDLKLFSGDVITLKNTRSNFYVKRYDSCEFYDCSHHTLLAYSSELDDYSKFTVEVVSSDTIRLIADNGRYVKILSYWKDSMSVFVMDEAPPDSMVEAEFEVQKLGGSKIALVSKNRRKYLKCYDSYEGKGIITSYGGFADAWSHFLIQRVGKKGIEVVTDLRFDLDNAMTTRTPLLIASQDLVNKASVEQEMSFSVSKSIATEKSFNWEHSFSIGVSTSFSFGVPTLGETSVEISLGYSFTSGGSKSDSEMKTYTATFPIKVPKNRIARASATVDVGTVDVPYKATVTRFMPDTDQPFSYRVSGTYYWTNVIKLKYVVEEIGSADPSKFESPVTDQKGAEGSGAILAKGTAD